MAHRQWTQQNKSHSHFHRRWWLPFQGPEAAKQPQSMIPPPPYFTFGMRFWSRCFQTTQFWFHLSTEYFSSSAVVSTQNNLLHQCKLHLPSTLVGHPHKMCQIVTLSHSFNQQSLLGREKQDFGQMQPSFDRYPYCSIASSSHTHTKTITLQLIDWYVATQWHGWIRIEFIQLALIQSVDFCKEAGYWYFLMVFI